MGESRTTALKRLSDRVPSDDMRNFVQTLVQSEGVGISRASILRNQANDLRQRRQSPAEERAQKAPVKMLFPIAVFILPVMFIVILGPAIKQASDALRHLTCASIELRTPQAARRCAARSPTASLSRFLGPDGTVCATRRARACCSSPGGSIHTFFMRFPLDVVFLDRDGTVRCAWPPACGPWRLRSRPARNAVRARARRRPGGPARARARRRARAGRRRLGRARPPWSHRLGRAREQPPQGREPVDDAPDALRRARARPPRRATSRSTSAGELARSTSGAQEAREQHELVAGVNKRRPHRRAAARVGGGGTAARRAAPARRRASVIVASNCRRFGPGAKMRGSSRKPAAPVVGPPPVSRSRRRSSGTSPATKRSACLCHRSSAAVARDRSCGCAAVVASLLTPPPQPPTATATTRASTRRRSTGRSVMRATTDGQRPRMVRGGPQRFE